jgi:hypothetical protein
VVQLVETFFLVRALSGISGHRLFVGAYGRRRNIRRVFRQRPCLLDFKERATRAAADRGRENKLSTYTGRAALKRAFRAAPKMGTSAVSGLTS